MKKEYLVWNKELEKLLKSYKPNMTIGFMGALGAHDIGDEAMLISNSEKIIKIKNNKVNFKIFSMNPENTDSYLRSKSLPFTYTFLSKSFIYKVCSLVDRIIQKPFIEGDRYNDILSEFYTLLWFFMNILKLNTGVIFGKYKKHINEVKNLDLLYIIGGAYINSWHVKSRIYPFLLEIIIAKKYNKNVVMSGLNLGPLNFFHRFFVRHILSYDNVKLIGVRDWEESLDEVGDNKTLNKKLYYSHDDAFYLDYSSEINPYKGKNYIVMQSHYWVASQIKTEKIKRIYKNIISHAVDNGKEVIIISMQSYKNNNDYKFSQEIVKTLEEKYRSRVTIPEKLYQPKVLKKIVSDALLLVSTRHHPFLFAVSTNVFAVAISYDNYYTQKFKGIASNNSRIFSIDNDENNIEEFCKKYIEEL